MSHRFLLLFRNVSNYRLQFQLAGRLRALGGEVDFLYEGGEDDLFRCLQREVAGLPARMLAFSVFVVESDISNPMRRAPHRLRGWLLDQLGRRQARENFHVFKRLHGQSLSAALRILRDLRPTALVVNEDGISGHLALIAAARELGIKILDVPFGYFSQSEFDSDLARKQAAGELHMADRALQRLAPQWVKQGRFAGAIMYPPLYIMGAEAMGVTLRDAWTVHGGLADVLCAESAKAVAHYVREGVPREKIELTGSPYCDVMVEAVADDPAARGALRAAQPIEAGGLRILVSWPPSYHDSRASEFPTYDEMTRAVLSFLRDLPGCTVTVSLHPATAPPTRQLAREIGLEPTDDYVIGLIPKHDIFVTSFSSTIRWATAAGKPVVNYDAYQWDIELFDSGGLFRESTFAGFKTRMQELTGSPAAFREAASRQIAEADDWGILDGRCSERIVAALDRLLH